MANDRVFGLDLMRASAIALVVLSHGAIWLRRFRPIYDFSFLGGYFGVEIFFVLSGFLIGGILFRWLRESRSSATLLGFWQRRWFRTLPNYFLFLGINYALALWIERDQPHVLRYLLFCQNISSPPPAFFNESWSLSIEEWFYVIVPILLAVTAKISSANFRTNSLAVIIVVISLVTVARIGYVIMRQPMWLQDVRQIVIYRLDACMFGVFGAWLKCFHRQWWTTVGKRLAPIGVASLVALAVIALTSASDSLFLHTSGFTLTSLGAVLLLPRLDAYSCSKSIAGKPVAWISKWSYSMYFVNLPVFAILFQRYHYNAPGFCIACFLVSSVVLAALFYHFYELPMMGLRDRPAITNLLLFGSNRKSFQFKQQQSRNLAVDRRFEIGRGIRFCDEHYPVTRFPVLAKRWGGNR